MRYQHIVLVIRGTANGFTEIRVSVTQAAHQALEMTGMKNRNSNKNCNPPKNPATRGMLPMASAAARLILLSGDVSIRQDTADA
jgi:hypothetical protein